MVNLIYFSNVTENTRRFVDKLDVPALRIPVREGHLVAEAPYVLISPTYGDGRRTRMVPLQVAAFLRDPHNRGLIRAVIASGNSNFGADYCAAGRVISERLGVPWLYSFELLGTPEDVEEVRQILRAIDLK